VDTSPTSEGTSSGNLPFPPWMKSLAILVDDTEGTGLFRQYLSAEALDDIAQFFFLCRGIQIDEEKTGKQYTTTSFRKAYDKYVQKMLFIS